MEEEEYGGRKKRWLRGKEGKRKCLWYTALLSFRNYVRVSIHVTLFFPFNNFTRYKSLGHVAHEGNEIQKDQVIICKCPIKKQ